MKRAAEKLNSRRGASILLALVFVLTCVMVGISVLSAAASNAGRTHSNHEEQQLYLSLSSALQLVADDLSNASYTPQVADDCKVGSYPRVIGQDEEGKNITISVATYTHEFGETTGLIDGCSLGSLFQKSLDTIFNTAMSNINFPSYNRVLFDEEFYYSGSFTSETTPISFTLTLTPEELPIDKDPYHAAQAVAVDVEIDEYYNITLTARLARDDADDYAKSFRLSTVLTRSSASLPKITIPTTDTSPTISASPTVTWKQGVVESAYVTGGVSP